MKIVRSYLYLFGIAGLVVALDQWTKYLVRSRLELGETWAPWERVGEFLRVVHWNNTGSAFGLFPSAGLIITFIAIFVTIVILIYFPQVPKEQWPLRLALALQMGGAIGNLTDRLLYGTVTDFIMVGSLPVFNVADSSISTGVAVLLVAMVFEGRGLEPIEEPVEGEFVEEQKSTDGSEAQMG